MITRGDVKCLVLLESESGNTIPYFLTRINGNSSNVLIPEIEDKINVIMVSSTNYVNLFLDDNGVLYGNGDNTDNIVSYKNIEYSVNTEYLKYTKYVTRCFDDIKFTFVKCGYRKAVAVDFDDYLWIWGEGFEVPKKTKIIHEIKDVIFFDNVIVGLCKSGNLTFWNYKYDLKWNVNMQEHSIISFCKDNRSNLYILTKYGDIYYYIIRKHVFLKVKNRTNLHPIKLILTSHHGHTGIIFVICENSVIFKIEEYSVDEKSKLNIVLPNSKNIIDFVETNLYHMVMCDEDGNLFYSKLIDSGETITPEILFTPNGKPARLPQKKTPIKCSG